MDNFIQKLRDRAVQHSKLALIALGVALIVVIGGVYLFIVESSRLAVHDIEQQRKINSIDEEISKLKNLYLDIENNENELSKERQKLDLINTTIERDGNYKLLYPKGLFYYQKMPVTSISAYDPLDLEPYKYGINLSVLKIKEIESLIHDIEESIIFYKSDEADEMYYENLKKEYENQKLRLEETKILLDKEKIDYYHAVEIAKKLGEAATDIDSRNRIVSLEKAIREFEININQFTKRISTEEVTLESKYLTQKALESNLKAIDKIKDFKNLVEKNLIAYKENSIEQQNLVKKLGDQQKFFKAQKEVDSRIKDNLPVISQDENKMAFYISTNIARLGIMVLTVFLSQVFISIYRYLTKISKFYDSRADALELLTKTEEFKNLELHSFIEDISNLLSPDKVDFGKMPQGYFASSNKGADLTIKT